MSAGSLWRDHGLIFVTELGAPLDPDNFSHELRHSGASLMLAQGTPLHVVSEILGHASTVIT